MPATPTGLRRASFVVLVVATLGNLVLVGGAALNAPWILEHVAGGQFTTLPSGIRVLYALMFVLMLAQVWFAWLLLVRDGAWSRTSSVISIGAVVIYVLSALVNAISPTPAERWNAIPAVLLAASFWVLRRRRPQDRVRGGDAG